MNNDEIRRRVQKVAELLLKEPPFPNREGIYFIRIVRWHYETIKELLDEGFSFEQLRAACEETGYLPKGSRTNSLRQAYYRETARRKKLESKGIEPAPWNKKRTGGDEEVHNNVTEQNLSLSRDKLTNWRHS